MARYAITTDGALVLTWPTPLGDHADVLARLDAATGQLREIADAATKLSASLWRTYTHPAGVIDDDDEGLVRDMTVAGFADLLRDVRATPALPGQAEMLYYDPAAHFANRLGAALAGLGDASLTEAVSADVAAEIDAVLRAYTGDLSGRAVQALTMSRVEASPVQVAEAHREFDRHLFGSDALFTGFEPSAAAVAAAHWLRAAATVAADVSGASPLSRVVHEADDIEAVGVETPVQVLDRLDEGESPEMVCADLIGSAMRVAAGVADDPGQLALRADHFLDGPAAEAGELFPLCLLDPTRPAIDLLEDLVGAITGCWNVYLSFNDDEVDAPGGAGSEDELRVEFTQRVRAAAAGWDVT